MWLPLTRDDWLEDQKLWRGVSNPPAWALISEDKVIRRNADWLLEHLYELDAEGCVRISKRRLRRARIEDEPVNWGDLSAFVEQVGDVFVVTLEEAADGQCPTLCAYVRSWLGIWGWSNIVVQTTW